MLEDPSKSGCRSCSGPIRPERLRGSWVVGARYRVQNVAALRQDMSLSSMEVGRAQQGEEVVLLGVGASDDTTDAKPRLRVKVRLRDGTVGWMSPQSESGKRLLCSDDLLSSPAGRRHRAGLAFPKVRTHTSFVLPKVRPQWRKVFTRARRLKNFSVPEQQHHFFQHSKTVSQGPGEWRRACVLCSSPSAQRDMLDTRDSCEHSGVRRPPARQLGGDDAGSSGISSSSGDSGPQQQQPSSRSSVGFGQPQGQRWDGTLSAWPAFCKCL